jgi:hypothetical protein
MAATGRNKFPPMIEAITTHRTGKKKAATTIIKGHPSSAMYTVIEKLTKGPSGRLLPSLIAISTQEVFE